MRRSAAFGILPVMETLLHPFPRLWLRLSVFAALVAFVSIGHASWVSKLGFVFWMAFFLGSFRIARLRDGFFERRMVFMFVPLKRKRWHLERFTQIETVWHESLHIGWALLIGPALWLWSHFFDWVIPWMGGNFQLRLRHVKGGPVLVWQGNSEANFEANLKILESNTALPIQRV
jgi:hypothetical protein